MTFLHGVETVEADNAGVTVQGVKSSVVAIVGTAPIHHVDVAERTIDEDVLCLSDVDDLTKFGPNVAGYTIPAELEKLRLDGTKFVVVVNVFDPATDKATEAAADLAIAADGTIQLDDPDIISETVKVEGGAGSALVEGTDYEIDRVKGIITVIEGGALDGETAANVTYDYGDPSAVLAADIIGTVVDGERTGMQAFLNSYSNRGFWPKIVIAPGYSTQLSVVNAIRALLPWDKLRAIGFVDAPIGTTVSEMVTGRGPSGTINFNVSDERLGLCGPHIKSYDKSTDSNVTSPLSTCAAGVLAYTDQQRGFWHSMSNKGSKAIVGLEYPLTMSLKDPSADCQLLNANGIITVFNAFGTGYRIFGNRSSSFPVDGSVKSFLTQRRIADQIHEALENAMMNVLDEPMTATLLADILQSGNAYMRTLIGRGAVPQGSRIELQSAKNPPSELAKGKATFTIIFVGTPPLEHIVFESIVDISLLASLAA